MMINSSDIAKFLLLFSFRAMSEGSGTAHSGPVSNAGPISANLIPASSVPAAGVMPQLPHPVPLLSISSHSNGNIPTAQGVQVGTTSSGVPNNIQPKIPPLMGIRTDTLPPPPPVQLPTTVPPSESTGDKSVVAEGPPRVEEPLRLQKRAQGGDLEDDSDGETDGKGEGGPLSQEDLV